MRLAYLALIMGGAIAALAFGIRSGFGLYLGPISLEFGYGREVFALSLAIQNLVWGVTQPFAGAIADRYGPFKAIAIGAVIYSAGTILLSFSNTPGMFHLSAGVLVGAGLAGTSVGIILGAVGQLFPPEKRSFALGVTGAASSLGQFLIVPAGQALLSTVGWNQSAMILGVLALLMLPLGLVFLKARPKPSMSDEPDQTMGQALKQAIGLPSFWLLSAGFFVCGFHVAYIAVHLPSFVVDIGLSAEVGAWALGLVGLFNVIGSLLAGYLGGRFPKKYLLSGLYFGRAVLMTGFVLSPPSEALVYVFAATMGLLWLSTVPLTSGLVADIFGPRYMTTLFGIVFLSHQIGGFLGAWLGGYVFDATGSYDIVWWISVGLGVFSGIVHWPIRGARLLKPAMA
jgi:MFS family permease